MSGPGPGHNNGRTLEPGASWRRHCWAEARDRLLPHLPVEVVRTRVRRAAELGLDYRTYAGVRASTGHDLVAFLFSSNALRLLSQRVTLDPARAEKLGAVRGAGRIVLATAPLIPEAVVAANLGALDAGFAAPDALARFGDAGRRLRAALGAIPADQVLLIGDMALERDWCAAGRLAGYLPAARYFGA